MAVERTLSIVKPDGVQKDLIGEVCRRFEQGGLHIVGIKMLHLTQEQAKGFYVVHKERPFYPDLVSYMTSGPVIVQILEGEDAIQKNREIMGATNPKEAKEGTIRKEFAVNLEKNQQLIPIMIPPTFNNENIARGDKFTFKVEVGKEQLLITKDLKRR